MSAKELKNKAKRILGEAKIQVLVGEEKYIKILEDIINEEVKEEEVEIKNKTLDNIEKYLYTKEKEIYQKQDSAYLKNIAEILRTQQVRVEDGVTLKNPVFKVTIDGEKEKQIFYFLTKEGADEFINANKVMARDLHKEKVENPTEDDRRKEVIFTVEKNENLELERLIEIIKRNF